MSGWEVRQGDCLALMADMEPGSVDAIVTDPPYGIGGEVVRQGGATVEALPAWDVFDNSWICSGAQALRPGGSMVAFTDTLRTGGMWAKMQAAGLHPRQIIFWLKQAPPPCPRRSFQSAVEVAVWATKPGATYEWTGGGVTPNCWHETSVSANREHPTQKPVALMRWLCRLVTPPGGLVLDPFCGSGTTGVAAVGEGFRFVGMELEPRFVQISRARLANTQAPLFDLAGTVAP